MQTRNMLSFVALSLVVAACDIESAVKCEKLTRALENGATCIIARQNDLPFDAEACDRDVEKFTKLGLTSHDAAKIVKVGAEDFYEAYYTDNFCEYMFPSWISRTVN